jgi:hypothetical protein
LFPYWLLFSLFAAGTVQYANRPPMDQGRALLTVGGIFLALMVGLRFEVGGDWFNYQLIYETMPDLKLWAALHTGDPAYGALNWFASYMEWEIWTVNMVCGAIFAWGLMRFSRQQLNPWLALVAAIPYFVIVVGMGYTRQGVAIAIIMAGIASMQDGKIGRFAIYIIFAAAFHKSAIVVLPLIGLAPNRRRILTIGLLILSGALLYYAFVQAALDSMMVNYVEENMESQGAAIRVAMNLPPALIFLAFQKRFMFSDIQRRIWRNFALASLLMLFLLVATGSSTAVDRIALYLIPLQIAVLSRLPHAFGQNGRSNGMLLAGVIVYSALIEYVWLTHAVNAYAWLPYKVYPLF